MQNLIFYVSAASTLGVAKDSLGVKNVALPTIIRGGEVCLKMRLFAGDGDDTPLPLDELTRCTAWEWAMDSDFDESTNYKLVADNANITVGSVTETDPEGVEHTYTEISIPIPATNTEELKEWLGTSESQNNLNGELAGYDATGKLTYILQLKGFTIRNRILSAGDPTELPEQYLDEAGVRALIGAGAEAQCATAADAPDGDWVDSTTAPDTHVWIRWRLRGNPSGAWSTPAKRIPGPAGATGGKGDKGDTGATGLVEIVSIEMTAPATPPSITEAEGSTAEHRKYILHIPRGEKGDAGTDGTDGADGAAAGFGTPTIAVETLPAGSAATASVTASGDDTAKIFSFNFGIPKGADGAGAGDMTKSVYDTNDDGIVDHAAVADAVGATTAAQVADAVGKAHTHANKATLDKLAEADGKLTYDGAEIGGGSGTVKSVNGQLPDGSGNVTVETGGVVDESRLLPALDSVPIDRNGNPLIYRYESGIDADTLCLLHLDDATWADATGKNTVTQKGSVAKVSPGYFDNALDLTASLSSGNLSWLQIPWIEDYAVDVWTMEFFAKPTKSLVNFTFLTFGTNGFMLNSEHLSNIRMDSYSADYAFTLGDWYWFVLQCDGTATKLYINNELVLQANFVPDIEGKTLQLGSHYEVNNQDNTFVGLIDEFRWSKGLRYPTGVMELPEQPFGTPSKGYKVSEKAPVTADSPRLLPENPANGDIPCFDATATIGGGNDANTRILLHFDADEIKDEAAGNAAPVTITKKTGTITVVEGGKWGKCAKYVTGSMTVATNLDELNANNWVVSGWFNPDENNHGVSYPTWLSMDDQNTHGFGFDSTGRYGESDGPLFYMDTPPAAGTWHWLAIVKYSGGLRFYLNGAFLNEISAQQRANFCSTLAIGGFAGTYAAGSTERTFSGLVDEVRLQYIPDDEITQWTGTSIAVPDAPYSKPQTVGEWGKLNKSELAMKSELTGKVNQSELAAYQKKSEAFSGQYSDLAGKPSTFPPAAHSHTIANVTDLQATVDKAHEHANKAALDKISEAGGKLAYGGTAVGGASGWTELADKPSTFPPAAHSHTIANVTDLQTMLNSKAASAHGHAVADVTGLQSLLDGKAAVGHTHAAADVTGLATALAGKVSSVNGLTPDDSGALVLPQATSGAAGLMAAADKLKLDTFTNYTEKSGTENSGYIRFPGGLIMQFGSKEVLTPEAFVSGSIVFPRSFVDKPLSVTASVEIDNLTNAPFAISLYAPNTISVVFSGPIVGLPDTLEKIVLHWMAIGIENKPPTNSDNV